MVVGVAGDEDVAHHIDDLDDAITVDDEVAVAVDEGEVVFVFVIVVGVEHQLEA